MTSQREQELIAQLADATQQCGAMADLLRDVVRWVVHGDAREWEKLIARIDALLAGKVPEPSTSNVERDAARYQFLRSRLEGAVFGEDDEIGDIAQLIFTVPTMTILSANCDATIDSAMTATPQPQGGEA